MTEKSSPVAAVQETGSRYLEWSPIVAGALLASALSLVLFSFTASVGLSLVSAEPARSSGRLAGTLVAFLALVVPIATLLAGGYLAGRMRTAWGELSADEVRFRDGIHGAVVWAVSMLLGAWIAGVVAAGAASHTASALSTTGNVVAPAIVDTLTRPAATAGGNQQPAGSTNVARAPVELRDEIGRVLLTAAQRGRFDQADRDYVVQTVARQSGVPPEEIERRVQRAYDEVIVAAENARKSTVAAGLIAGIAAMLALAAAWSAAQIGGSHRDSNTPARFTWDIPAYRIIRTKA